MRDRSRESRVESRGSRVEGRVAAGLARRFLKRKGLSLDETRKEENTMTVRNRFLSFRWVAIFLLLAAVCSCQAGDDRPERKKESGNGPAISPLVKTAAKIKLASSAFEDGSPIPQKRIRTAPPIVA